MAKYRDKIDYNFIKRFVFGPKFGATVANCSVFDELDHKVSLTDLVGLIAILRRINTFDIFS